MDVESSKLEKLKSILRVEAAYYWDDVVALLRMCGLGRFVSQESHQASHGVEEKPGFSSLGTTVKPASEIDRSIVTIKPEADAKESASNEGTAPPNGPSRLAQIVAARGKTPFATRRTPAAA